MVPSGLMCLLWEPALSLMEPCFLFCNPTQGSLRAALDAGRLRDARTGRPDLQVMLPLSLDVARALHHMHQEQLLHGDLKASNVLLAQGTVHGLLSTPGDSQSGGSGSSGTVAASEVAQSGSILALVKERPFRLVGKVSDFGLSLAMDSDITHVSHMHAVSDGGL